ncbi:glutamate 5-kinase [Pirellulales bacterium]|jgi:glutamate 5-kinase|nr:glutamate 5-kinase [Pirellulales bacterium]
MIDPLRKEAVQSAKLIVVKIGSRVLTTAQGLLDIERVEHIGQQCHELLNSGRQIVVVSSGAVGAGMGRLGMHDKPCTLPELQAVAAVGQSCLTEAYERALGSYGRHVAQLLLVADDLHDRGRYLNIRNTLRSLLKYGAIPIVNENDSVSTAELQTTFGDNDHLAALVATLLGADALILLSDVECLFDQDPENPEARRVSTVRCIDAATESMVHDRSAGVSKGGMASKLKAAKTVNEAGIHCFIGSGRRESILQEFVSGHDTGTFFPGRNDLMPAKKRWLGWSASVSGKLTVDSGARQAVIEQGSSLLPAGVLAVAGNFVAGDVVTIETTDGNCFARGFVNYNSRDLEQIKGLQTERVLEILGVCACDEVIHRDDLAVICREESAL